jgi:hypothetical protein
MSFSIRIAFGAYAVLVRLAQRESASEDMTSLLGIAEGLPSDATGGWGVDGVLHFVETDAAFQRIGGWAKELVKVISSWERNALIDHLRTLSRTLGADHRE